MLDQLKNLVLAFLRQAAALLRAFLSCVEDSCDAMRVPQIRLWPTPPSSVSALARARKWSVKRRFLRPSTSRGNDSEGFLLAA
jgi:hypothetical protein